MIWLLIIVTFLILLLIYLCEKDIISPSFVFCGVFLIAELNVLTNVDKLNVRISEDTFIVVIGGILIFFIGSLIAGYIVKRIKFSPLLENRELYLNKKNMTVLLFFNIFSIGILLSEVYKLTIEKAMYSGSILGALSVYAEVSKFQSIDMSISTMGTLLAVICEAEGYTLGYIIADNWARKKNVSKVSIWCFITAFLSTFCQGSRGGVFMIIVAIFVFVLAYREERNINNVGFKLIFEMLLVVCLLIGIFQVIGVVTGKMWDISFYDYFSVYLGDPLINLNTKLHEGIIRSQVMGQTSFPTLVKKIFQVCGREIPSYYGLSNFQYYEGHNLGNVYTIFAYLIADYGVLGMFMVLLIIGFCIQSMYIIAKKCKTQTSVERVIWAYMLASVAFSFFSNKICQNITFFRLIMFVFVWLLMKNMFTRKSRI